MVFYGVRSSALFGNHYLFWCGHGGYLVGFLGHECGLVVLASSLHSHPTSCLFISFGSCSFHDRGWCARRLCSSAWLCFIIGWSFLYFLLIFLWATFSWFEGLIMFLISLLLFIFTEACSPDIHSFFCISFFSNTKCSIFFGEFLLNLVVGGYFWGTRNCR